MQICCLWQHTRLSIWVIRLRQQAGNRLCPRKVHAHPPSRPSVKLAANGAGQNVDSAAHICVSRGRVSGASHCTPRMSTKRCGQGPGRGRCWGCWGCQLVLGSPDAVSAICCSLFDPSPSLAAVLLLVLSVALWAASAATMLSRSPSATHLHGVFQGIEWRDARNAWP